MEELLTAGYSCRSNCDEGEVQGGLSITEMLNPVPSWLMYSKGMSLSTPVAWVQGGGEQGL
jgi:hypothetical protein